MKFDRLPFNHLTPHRYNYLADTKLTSKFVYLIIYCQKKFQETYQKFKANPPPRLKRKAEKQRLEREEAKRIRDSEDPRLHNSESNLNQNNNFAFGENNNTNMMDEQQKEATINNNGSSNNEQTNSSKSHINENGTTEPAIHISLNGGDPSQLAGLTRLDSEGKEKKAGGPKILLTGFVPSELTEAQKMCSELGLEVTSQARLATHLVMPSLNRTIALLCAVNYVKFVLSVDWIKDSHKDKKLKGKKKISIKLHNIANMHEAILHGFDK